jgi:hypothetical protein
MNHLELPRGADDDADVDHAKPLVIATDEAQLLTASHCHAGKEQSRHEQLSRLMTQCRRLTEAS